MSDRGARPVIVAGGKRCAHVVLVARGDAEPDDVDQQVLAFGAHGRGQRRGVERGDALGQLFGDGGIMRRHGHALRRRTLPKPGIRLTAMTTAKVMVSIMIPSTEMAARSPLSFRSK